MTRFLIVLPLHEKQQSGGSGAGLEHLVNFYSRLPKGEATARVSGIKGRYFSGGNASGKPLVALIFGIWAISYTLDYHSVLTSFPVMITPNQYSFLVHLSTSFDVFFCYTFFNGICRTPQEPHALDLSCAGLYRGVYYSNRLPFFLHN